MSLLNNLTNPSDVKRLTDNELNDLAGEVRELIISVTEDNGGHLASSLGAVDGIIALLKAFDFEKDRIIFDVGHQAYAYKILTDRRDSFSTLRQEGGISGFPLIFESKYDSFTSGHAGDSIAAALGYCNARDLLNEDYNVIAYVGDASFVNGENLEALFASDSKPKKLLIVLNDNGMSISKNANGLYKLISQMPSKSNEGISGGQFMESLGFKYEYCNGHDIQKMTEIFSKFRENGEPTLVHIATQKGKGYLPAEASAEAYHGVAKDFNHVNSGFSNVAGQVVLNAVTNDEKIVSIVAGMSYGTGMEIVKNNFPKNFIDVGISEDLAVTYAAGLALGGLKPVVCIYSTFLQRAYDQIVTNVCLQNLPVVFLIDRAGVVGADGFTHQGSFDLSYLSHVPNLTILTPKDGDEFEDLFNYAQALNSPVAIRYPNGEFEEHKNHVKISKNSLWEVVKDGSGKVVLACGSRALNIALEAAKSNESVVINARTVKPLDEQILSRYFDRDFITVEDNSLIGGFGSLVSTYLCNNNYKGNLKCLGLADKFISHGSSLKQLENSGISVENLIKYL